MPNALPLHLKRLEAEAIHIMREVVSEFRNPVMLYSIGKDSSAMLHVALKAFYPAPLPFSLLHVDTTWKFREMIAFRDDTAKRLGFNLRVHINADGVARGISPVASGSQVHTQVMKTEALRQALDAGKFDAAFGGARRDEEKSRAKERIFSHRSAAHAWDPRNQRPELWKLYNTRIREGESMRVFPLSNWTELDVWEYIRAEEIPVVPLYFAKERPVVERGDTLIIYLTGCGQTTPIVGDGLPAPGSPFALALIPPSVQLGGTALGMSYAGLAPGQVGVCQINATVPRTVPTGLGLPLTITQGSSAQTLALRVID